MYTRTILSWQHYFVCQRVPQLTLTVNGARRIDIVGALWNELENSALICLQSIRSDCLQSIYIVKDQSHPMLASIGIWT